MYLLPFSSSYKAVMSERFCDQTSVLFFTCMRDLWIADPKSLIMRKDESENTPAFSREVAT